MDSKIKRLTFLGMLSAILMIAVIVVFVNRDKLIETAYKGRKNSRISRRRNGKRS